VRVGPVRCISRQWVGACDVAVSVSVSHHTHAHSVACRTTCARFAGYSQKAQQEDDPLATSAKTARDQQESHEQQPCREGCGGESVLRTSRHAPSLKSASFAHTPKLGRSNVLLTMTVLWTCRCKRAQRSACVATVVQSAAEHNAAHCKVVHLTSGHNVRCERKRDVAK
jgi:hypothetical protein